MFDNYIVDSWQKGLLYGVTILVIAILMFAAKKKLKFGYRVLIGLALGIVVGLTLGQTKTMINGEEATIMATIRPIGLIYLRLIQMVVMPLILTAIIKSFTSLEDTNKLKKIGIKTLFWLLITTTVATAIGFLFAYIPGLGKDFVPIGGFTRDITPVEDVILNFFPNNIASALSGNVAIPVIVFATLVSVAVIVEEGRKPGRMEPFLKFNTSLNYIMTRITKFIMRLTPYAAFAFISYAIGRSNFEILKQLGVYIVLIHLAMLTHFLLIQMGLLKLHGIKPTKFVKKYSPAMTMAFTTQSSYGTLPVTIKSLTERVGVSERVANFVGPISANVGMNACGGIFPAMVAVITANAYGIPFGIFEFILLLVVTTISSIGIAGVPGIATIAATVTLSSLGLPIEGIALIIAVDPLIDMSRTLVNVIGGGVSATLVAKSENELNNEVLNSAEAPDISK